MVQLLKFGNNIRHVAIKNIQALNQKPHQNVHAHGLVHRLHTSQVSDVFALHRCVAVYLLIDTRLYCLHG